jgi:hypothetical protein
VQPATGDLLGHFSQVQVAIARVAAQPVEGGLHGQAVVVGEHALGLFDDDSAVQGGLELFGDDFASADGLLLQDSDGGHVGQACPRVRSDSGSGPGLW